MLTFISVLLFLGSSAFLIWLFLKLDRGPKEPVGALLAAGGFGLLAIAAAIWAELFLPKANAQVTVGALLFTSLGVGLIEESAKFVPLSLFIRNKSYFNEHTDGVIYFAIVGLTFGFVENMMYLFAYRDRGSAGQFTGIFRLIALFFFHAASTGIVGYYFAKAKIHKNSLVAPIIALVTMMFIHGFYDFLFFLAATTYQRNAALSDNGSALVAIALVGGLIISALLNTALFLYYARARQWDASIGLSVDPNLPVAPQPTPMNQISNNQMPPISQVPTQQPQ